MFIGVLVPASGKLLQYAPFQLQWLGMVSPTISVLARPSEMSTNRKQRGYRPNIPTELPIGAGAEIAPLTTPGGTAGRTKRTVVRRRRAHARGVRQRQRGGRVAGPHFRISGQNRSVSDRIARAEIRSDHGRDGLLIVRIPHRQAEVEHDRKRFAARSTATGRHTKYCRAGVARECVAETAAIG